MLIKLLCDVPVHDDHGMTEGRILRVLRTDYSAIRNIPRWYVRGDTGEEVGILYREAEILKDKEGEDAEIPQAPR